MRLLFRAAERERPRWSLVGLCAQDDDKQCLHCGAELGVDRVSRGTLGGWNCQTCAEHERLGTLK